MSLTEEPEEPEEPAPKELAPEEHYYNDLLAKAHGAYFDNPVDESKYKEEERIAKEEAERLAREESVVEESERFREAERLANKMKV